MRQLILGSINNQRGSSLPMAIIAMVVTSMVAASLMTIINNSNMSMKYVEQKDAMLNLHNEIKSIIGNENLCHMAFKDVNLSELESGKSVKLNSLPKPDGTPFVRPYEVAQDTYENNNLKIESLILKDYTPLPLAPNERYKGHATLEIGYRKNIKSLGPELNNKNISVALEFKRDSTSGGVPDDNGHNKELNRCTTQGVAETKVLETAIAQRQGVALNGLNCQAVIQPEDYQGLPGCIDNNGDFRCDQLTADGRRLSKKPHPWASPTHESFKASYFNELAPEFGSIATGRCPVNIIDGPLGTPPENIFKVYNGTNNSGLGCRKDNGWVISSCSIAYNGMGGDSDVFMQVTASGDQVCYTNDFQQPHIDGDVWVTKKVILSVSCMRMVTK